MRSKIPLRILAVGLTLALHIAVPAGAALAAETATPQPVETLRSSLNAYDVEGSVSVFAENAVVIQPRMGGLPQVYVGREQIRWWLRNLAAQHAQFGGSASAELNGAHVRWSEFLSTDGFRQLGLAAVEIESDVILADAGLIESLTTVLSPRSARAMQGVPDAAASVTDVAERPGAEAVVGSAGLISAGFAGGAATMLWLGRRRQRAVGSINLPAPTTG
jgi:hypothetical protein